MPDAGAVHVVRELKANTAFAVRVTPVRVTPVPIAVQCKCSLFHHVLPDANESRGIVTRVGVSMTGAGAASDGHVATTLCDAFSLGALAPAVTIDIEIVNGSGLAAMATQQRFGGGRPRRSTCRSECWDRLISPPSSPDCRCSLYSEQDHEHRCIMSDSATNVPAWRGTPDDK